MAIYQPWHSEKERKRRELNTELLAALGFNLAAWLVVGVVAWSVIH